MPVDMPKIQGWVEARGGRRVSAGDACRLGSCQNEHSMPPHKYARIERERRFLLEKFPNGAEVHRIRRITDYYLENTTLRLRIQVDDGNSPVFKLTQKTAEPGAGAQQGWITTMYLAEQEFLTISQLPSRRLDKIRYSVPPFGIDVFEDALSGLILAEAEFDSAASADALVVPNFILLEVTDDARFTGGELVRTSRGSLADVLNECGIRLAN